MVSLVCSALWACEGAESAPEVQRTAAERFYVEFLKLHADALAACCPEIGPARPGETHVSVPEWTRNPWLDGIVQAGVDACLESMRAAGPTCAAIDARLGAATDLCARVFRLEDEQAPDADSGACAVVGGCERTLGERGHFGDLCSWSCEDEDSGRCQVVGDIQWESDRDARCLRTDGLFCGKDDRCMPLLAEGVHCDRDVQCETGLFCGWDGGDGYAWPAQCLPVHAVGEQCSLGGRRESNCGAGYCDFWEHVCKTPLPEGAECDVTVSQSADVCGRDALCYAYSGLCLPKPRDDHAAFCVNGTP